MLFFITKTQKFGRIDVVNVRSVKNAVQMQENVELSS